MKKRILCVEDNVDNKLILRTIQESMDYEVLEADEGETALSIVYNNPPNLILTDMHLPGMNGLELTSHIKYDLSLKHIPVIALTADIYARNAFLQTECDAFLTKPIRRGSLLRTVNQVFTTSEIHPSIQRQIMYSVH